MIRFTKHAEEKFGVLKRHGLRLSRKAVIATVERPKVMDYSRLPLKIAQRVIDKTHVLRVVYREENDTKIIITFYPGRINQYEKNKQ